MNVETWISVFSNVRRKERLIYRTNLSRNYTAALLRKSVLKYRCTCILYTLEKLERFCEDYLTVSESELNTESLLSNWVDL